MTVQKSDFRTGGKAYIYQGEEITVKDLFNLSLVASSNSATVVLSRSTGLSQEEFIKKMLHSKFKAKEREGYKII